MSRVTVPGACHTTEPVHHNHNARDLVHRLSQSILAHLHGRAERLEAEAAECRRQAAVHTAECHKAGITFIDLADVHTVDGSAVAPRCSVDGSAGGRRFDVV